MRERFAALQEELRVLYTRCGNVGVRFIRGELTDKNTEHFGTKIESCGEAIKALTELCDELDAYQPEPEPPQHQEDAASEITQ